MQAESSTSEHPVKAKHPASLAVTATPDFLRRVAEEVRAAFPRPMRTPQLVLIDVDPRHLHAFWSLAAGEVARARRELGSEGDSAPMVLRIAQSDSEGSSAAAFDVEVVGLQGRCYVEIWGEARGYSGTLGLRPAGDSLRPLAGPATIRLPNIGPADQRPAREAAADQIPAPEPAAGAGMTLSAAAAVPATTAPANPSERTPISPFPQPPSGPGAHDAPAAPGESLEEARPEPADAAGNAPLPAAAAIQSAPAARIDPPETLRHPFPVPPADPDEYVPEALIGGFLPEDTPAEEHHTPVVEAPLDAEAGAEAEVPQVADGEPAVASQPQALPLENVLTLSSYALGREVVDFEINAELHVFGRARPGTRLQLFGRPVALRPDGSFSITRPLPNGALVLSSLIVEGDGETPE